MPSQEARDALKSYGVSNVAERIKAAIKNEAESKSADPGFHAFVSMRCLVETFQRLPGMYEQFVLKGVYSWIIDYFWERRLRDVTNWDALLCEHGISLLACITA